jgi:hypothetical protein
VDKTAAFGFPVIFKKLPATKTSSSINFIPTMPGNLLADHYLFKTILNTKGINVVAVSGASM